MSRLGNLKVAITNIYKTKNPLRAEWADWLYAHHVFLVADYARELSKKLGVNNDLAEAAAMLHDIADAVMKRSDPAHEETNLKLAGELLTKAEYKEHEKEIIIDALKHHGCHGSDRPSTIEGRILATADAVVHLRSDFYDFARTERLKTDSPENVAAWAMEKIERDFRDKISFEDIRAEVAERYKNLIEQFSSL